MSENTHLVRQRKLAATLEAQGFPMLALNAGPSLRYLTGLDFHLSERPVLFFFSSDASAVAVLPELEKEKLNGVGFEVRAHTYGEDPSTWGRTLKNAALDAHLDFKRVGIEPTRLRVIELKLLENAAPRSAYVSASGVVAALRMYKDPDEISAMRKAVEIAQDALTQTTQSLREGITEREAASELVLQLLRGGSGSELPFSPIVAFGDHASNPHAVPGDRRLKKGDLVLFDWGATVNGYASDLTRMFAFGDPGEEAANIVSVVHAANEAARKATRPGITAGDVDRAARQVIEQAGHGPAFVHRTGHGLGLETHEEPYIRAGSEVKLEDGMVFTIEPGIYIPGRAGARIEDDVVVTDDGCESLSSMPRELKILSA